MQTSKVKINEIYAMKRGDKMVRFLCTEIVTHKNIDGTTSEIFGNVIEDRTGAKPDKINLNPQDLIGPYEEQAELVARRDREDAERAAKKEAHEQKARADRLALYEFVGVTPPAKRDEYRQLFRCTFGSVDISNEGRDAIIARVHELRDAEMMAVEAADKAKRRAVQS